MELKSRRNNMKLQYLQQQNHKPIQNQDKIDEYDSDIIMIKIGNFQKDIPFAILGNSNFDQKYIHIREIYKNNPFYEARYGYFSKINELSSDDIYTLTLFSNKRLLYFMSEYGVSLSSDVPTIDGVIIVDQEINENNKVFVVSSTKNCSVIIR